MAVASLADSIASRHLLCSAQGVLGWASFFRFDRYFDMEKSKKGVTHASKSRAQLVICTLSIRDGGGFDFVIFFLL